MKISVSHVFFLKISHIQMFLTENFRKLIKVFIWILIALDSQEGWGVVNLIVYRKFSYKNILWKYLENINIDIIDYV